MRNAPIEKIIDPISDLITEAEYREKIAAWISNLMAGPRIRPEAGAPKLPELDEQTLDLR